jgi:hypothetical protein
MTTLEQPPVNTLLVTTDYSIFKRHPCNREIKVEHVQKIAESISKKSFLSSNPIFVDTDMQVIDGQHRLKAAELLALPIYYIVNAEIVEEDIILLNSSRRNWNSENYADFYSAKGNRHYQNLKDYSKLYQVPLPTLFIFTLGGADNSKNYENFRQGFYKFPEGNKLKKITDTLEFRIQIRNELLELAIPSAVKHIIRGNAFCRALLSFLSIEEVIPQVLKDKLKLQAEKIKACPTQHAYYSMLKEIYNWKNKNPIR